MMLVLMAVVFCLAVAVLLALIWRHESRRQGATVAAGTAWVVAALLVVIGGVLYWGLGYKEQTGQWLDEHRQLEPVASEILAGRSPGQAAGEDTSTGPLARVLQRELVRQPESVSGWYALGMLYQQMEAPRRAAQAARKGLEVAGGDQRAAMEVLLARALVAANGGKLNPEAEQILLDVVEREPAHDGAWILLAMSASRSGRHELAERAFATLVERHGDGEMGETLRKGLKQARAAQKGGGDPAESGDDSAPAPVTVEVNADDSLQPGGTIFVFLRSGTGGGKPLAARRMPVEGFPVTVRVRPRDWLQSPSGAPPEDLRAGARYSTGSGGVGGADLRAAPVPLSGDGEGPDARLELSR